MSESNEGLRRLHKLHLKLRDVRDELVRGPKQIQARQQLVAKGRADVEQKTEQFKQARATADRKSLDLKTNEAKIADLRAKLNVASSNKEYDVIRGQIEADTVANSVLEDEILDALEKVDRLQVELAGAQQHLTHTEAGLKKCEQDVAAAEGGLKASVEQLEGQIRETEAFLPATVAADYRRLVHAHGPDALAAVDGTVCTNCYVSLTAQSRVLLNSGEIVFCKSCGRLLYLPEAED